MLYASTNMMSHTGERFEPFCVKVFVEGA